MYVKQADDYSLSFADTTCAAGLSAALTPTFSPRAPAFYNLSGGWSGVTTMTPLNGSTSVYAVKVRPSCWVAHSMWREMLTSTPFPAG